MKWPFYSRKRIDEERRCERIIAADLRNEREKLEKHNATLKATIGTLRAEAIAQKKDIQALEAKVAELEKQLQATGKKTAPPNTQPRLGSFVRSRDALESATRANIPVQEKEATIKEKRNGI